MEYLTKKHKLHLISKVQLFLSVFLLVSCGSEDVITEETSIQIKILYEDANQLIPDAGAKVYVYYDIFSMDLVGFLYAGEGVFEKGNLIIKPDQYGLADKYGEVIISPIYLDKKLTIITESNFYKDRRTNSAYLSCESDIVETVIFKP